MLFAKNSMGELDIHHSIDEVRVLRTHPPLIDSTLPAKGPKCNIRTSSYPNHNFVILFISRTHYLCEILHFSLIVLNFIFAVSCNVLIFSLSYLLYLSSLSPLSGFLPFPFFSSEYTYFTYLWEYIYFPPCHLLKDYSIILMELCLPAISCSIFIMLLSVFKGIRIYSRYADWLCPREPITCFPIKIFYSGHLARSTDLLLYEFSSMMALHQWRLD